MYVHLDWLDLVRFILRTNLFIGGRIEILNRFVVTQFTYKRDIHIIPIRNYKIV